MQDNNATIKIKKLSPTAKIPVRMFTDPAGADLCADIPCAVSIQPHTTEMIGTGFALQIPSGYFGAIAARSGLAAKQGLRPANCLGVVDADYRGEIKVALHNDTNFVQTVEPGDRIAQLLIIPCLSFTFEETDELTETQRGEDGFGSTGVQ